MSLQQVVNVILNYLDSINDSTYCISEYLKDIGYRGDSNLVICLNDITEATDELKENLEEILKET